MTLILLAAMMAPPDLPTFDARLTRLENEHMAMKAEIAALRTQIAKCPCVSGGEPMAAVPVTGMTTVCGPNGCTTVPVQGMYGAPMFSFGEGGGSCANGSCGTSSNGGRRGLFGRRRR